MKQRRRYEVPVYIYQQRAMRSNTALPYQESHNALEPQGPCAHDAARATQNTNSIQLKSEIKK